VVGLSIVIDSISLKTWKIIFGCIFLSMFFFSQFGPALSGKREIYPFFAWWLFTRPTETIRDYELELVHWANAPVDSPCSVVDCRLLKARQIMYAAPYGLVQEFGKAFVTNSKRARSLQLDIQNYLLEGKPAMARLKIRTFSPRLYLLGMETPTHEFISNVEFY
jgi:hypothetical protein